jgi:DNA replication and repair protein RecF
MHISSLSLSNFRNYTLESLIFGARPVVLVGKNGAGKTNILEALSFLTPGRGIRRAVLSSIDKEANAQGWGVIAELSTLEGIVQITTGREAGDSEKRIVKIDGKSAKSHNDLSRYLSMLWLTPAMDGIFTDSDTAKRRFLDRLVFSLDDEHAGRVSRFEHAMRERNKLLEEPSFDDHWAALLEQTMTKEALAISQARLETVRALNDSMQTSHTSFPKAHITLKGIAEDVIMSGAMVQDIERAALEKYRQMRAVDAASGRCTYGLHRCEMHTVFEGRGTPASQCSTGEQKALLLSIILSQARVVKERKNIAPILLLDEVVAHLDESRRRDLAATLFELGGQAFLTGTDIQFFKDFVPRSQSFMVETGKIESL